MARRSIFASALVLLTLSLPHHVNCQPGGEEANSGLGLTEQSNVVDIQPSGDQAPGIQATNPLDEFDVNVVLGEGTGTTEQVTNPPVNANPWPPASRELQEGDDLEFSPEYLAKNQQMIRDQAAAGIKALGDAQFARIIENPGSMLGVQWAPEYESLIISWQTWQDFLTALGTETQPDNNPIYYLMRDSKTIRTVLTQIDMIYKIMLEKIGKNSITIDERYRGLIQRGWEIIRPLIDIDLTTSPQYEYMVYPAVIAPEGLFNVTATDLADPSLLNNAVERLFRFAEVGSNTILVTESQMVALWTLLTTVQLDLKSWISDLQNKIILDVFRFPPTDRPAYPTGVNPPRVGRYKRGVIGYKEYFAEKYIGEFDTEPLPPFSTTSKKDTEPWRSWRKNTRITFDMYVQPLLLWGKIYGGLIPNMLEMVADVAYKANQQLGKKSIYPEPDFVYPLLTSAYNIDAWLLTYPEWDAKKGHYVPDVSGFKLAQPQPAEQNPAEQIRLQQIPVGPGGGQ
ncbi:hypothetical protein ABW21_db0206707 [Orbilia brochopaga]|nr:hypothetical protein ABW21_db0206707 [Drechslerella brochopaga]